MKDYFEVSHKYVSSKGESQEIPIEIPADEPADPGIGEFRRRIQYVDDTFEGLGFSSANPFILLDQVYLEIQNDEHMFYHALEHGRDVYFRDSLGVSLPFELVTYNQGTGRWWIRANNTVKANRLIYMYYGDTSKTTDGSTDIWESSVSGNNILVCHGDYIQKNGRRTRPINSREFNGAEYTSYSINKSLGKTEPGIPVPRQLDWETGLNSTLVCFEYTPHYKYDGEMQLNLFGTNAFELLSCNSTVTLNYALEDYSDGVRYDHSIGKIETNVISYPVFEQYINYNSINNAYNLKSSSIHLDPRPRTLYIFNSTELEQLVLIHDDTDGLTDPHKNAVICFTTGNFTMRCWGEGAHWVFIGDNCADGRFTPKKRTSYILYIGVQDQIQNAEFTIIVKKVTTRIIPHMVVAGTVDTIEYDEVGEQDVTAHHIGIQHVTYNPLRAEITVNKYLRGFVGTAEPWVMGQSAYGDEHINLLEIRANVAGLGCSLIAEENGETSVRYFGQENDIKSLYAVMYHQSEIRVIGPPTTVGEHSTFLLL